jgi:hypothetical protein
MSERIVAPMKWSRCRRAAGLYCVLFFLAVTAAPHHHLNDLEDLLLDQRSDSGLVVLQCGTAERTVGEALQSCSITRDVACLACFTRDFVSVPTSAFTLVAVFARLPLRPEPPAIATPQLLPAETSSRAPPLSS